MDALTTAMLATALSALMSYIAYKTGCLTRDGAAASFLVGAFTGIVGSVSAFVLLIIFTVSGFVATRIGFEKKKKAGLQEGSAGERNWKNVAGVGIPPCVIVALNALFPMDPLLFDVMFVSTMTVAGADTIASEIGVKDPKAYLITTFKRVPPGTNGGVSLMGTAISTVAALGIAVIGWLVMTGTVDPLLLIPFVAGVVGNLLDSLFGTLLEDRGYISKYLNNGLTAILGAAFGAGVYVAS
ncbi:MAG: DUF92 domain-containing protein [Candidatus Methanomethylophilaceae archaeon]|nr:DUF92 domain-containing protein [Candidatus Methanomethylophilaceae archaeon]